MTKKKPFTERDREDADGPFMDNPERIKTDKVSLHDMHEDMKFVDPIPLEDARMEWQEEEVHRDTKSNSSSEEMSPGSEKADS
ncbi:hypothetical protein JSQ81_13470 [Sporosarcina sp. Marseille-Q4063]|uniref:hypothetical protein n=1 Tax=Sporosarcina sp. Marseille-Q4063 TaxID=2810514 RepID=UPI001BAEFBC0|nr:hypothetical protein [Sporosarcina sp. Marseille-Q4063]QUW20823.1 hypothetical protein JSQ81_13470 [Sporosarcina sp. Marseille-Q4063]